MISSPTAYSESIEPRYDATILSRVGAAVRSFVMFMWRWLVGAAACQYGLLAVIAVGWTYRLMQRYAVKQWCRICSEDRRHFHRFIQQAGLDELAKPPNWIVRQNARTSFVRDWEHADTLGGKIYALTCTPFASLWKNFSIGIKAILTTWALTMPACVLWQFSWHAGWNNSFNKIYEQFYVGALTGWIGIVIFIAVMFYVPMAQARQAVTGEWRAFFQFRLVWKLIRTRWFSCVALAGLYSLVLLPITISKIVLTGIPNDRPEFETMSNAEILQFLNTYYFWTGFAVIAGYIIVHLAAVRIYTKAVVQTVRKGTLKPEQLAPFERSVLRQLDADHAVEQPERHPIIKAGFWAGKRSAGLIGGVLMFLLWLTFTTQIYLTAFFNYQPLRNWLNQPLVQLPWVRYIPQHLNEVEKQVDIQTPQVEEPVLESVNP